MPIIDVHTHMFTRRWLEYLRESGSPYSVGIRPDGREEIFRGETPVVFPQPGHFDYGLRIATMDEAGIDVSDRLADLPERVLGRRGRERRRRPRVERVDGRRAAGLPGAHPLVRVVAVAVPGTRRRGTGTERATTARSGSWSWPTSPGAA